jgi:hypothetical protein
MHVRCRRSLRTSMSNGAELNLGIWSLVESQRAGASTRSSPSWTGTTLTTESTTRGYVESNHCGNRCSSRLTSFCHEMTEIFAHLVQRSDDCAGRTVDIHLLPTLYVFVLGPRLLAGARALTQSPNVSYCILSFTDKGYVMVGDSVNKATNKSIQFARFSGDVYRDGVVHEEGWYRLFKVDPVTFPGFVPVKLNRGRNAVYLGQNITVVSYGPADSVASDVQGGNLTWPGQALEGTLEVTKYEDANEFFSAGNTGVGVCIGTY